MSYSAESNSSFVEDFETELVDELIRTAVISIFGCDLETTGKIAPNTEEILDGKQTNSSSWDCFESSLNANSLLTLSSCSTLSGRFLSATCDPTVDVDNECFVMQTTFIIGVRGPVDTDVAAYEAYKAIQEKMDNGTYAEAVEEVVFLEFLSPRPLLEPPSSGGGSSNSPNGVDDSDVQRNVDVSPWAIGFSVASVMGGFVSLMVWARSRRSRQNRRARLEAETTTPWVGPEGETVL